MRKLSVVLLLVLLAGCETVAYYGQAIRGQLGLLASARPIDRWLADPATPPDLRTRLEIARRIREFASRSLALPENASYSSYAELGRPYPVWNVFAAPRFAVEPKQECFPFTGCVSYRGFFSEAHARRHAERLRKDGYDVHVGGVPAYSTLGWFDDPLLSSFIRYPEAQLARLLFHELAHQRVYAKNDTTFNESFAVAVEEEGVRRWLEAQGRGAELIEFRAAQGRKREFAARVKQTRERLAEIYRQGLPEQEMLQRKRAEYAKLHAAYPALVPEEANNAYLGSIALYTELVPWFERLLAEQRGDLEAFYRQVEHLATDTGARRRQLNSAEYRPPS
jgi:predicted aminopeptidase